MKWCECLLRQDSDALVGNKQRETAGEKKKFHMAFRAFAAII